MVLLTKKKKPSKATMAALLPTLKLNFLQRFPSSDPVKRVALKPAFCSAVQQVEKQEEKVGILCEPCNGTGWLLCDFCNGQKVNVKSPTNRIYRRCPSCKAGLTNAYQDHCIKNNNSQSRKNPNKVESGLWSRLDTFCAQSVKFSNVSLFQTRVMVSSFHFKDQNLIGSRLFSKVKAEKSLY